MIAAGFILGLFIGGLIGWWLHDGHRGDGPKRANRMPGKLPIPRNEAALHDPRNRGQK